MPAVVPPRTHPHELGQMYLYVFRPEAVLATTVNGNIGRVQTVVTNAADCSAALRGMTLLVGTSAGARDKGIVRIRTPGVGANLLVSEHEINLLNGDHLTVLDEYRLWHVDPFIDGFGVIYKDCNDANAPAGIIFAIPGPLGIYQPVPVMGPHSIQWIGEQHGFDWSNSWPIAPGATIPVLAANYTGTFPGAIVTYATPRTGNAFWGVAGAEWATLVVTDNNAVASEIGKRLYVTLDPTWTVDEAKDEGLYVDFRPSPRLGSVDGGGFSMQFTVYTDASEDDFPDEALIFWFFDNGTQEDIGGNWPDRTHIHFIGHIVKASTHKEPETGYVTFEAVTVQALMKSCPTFPNFLEINAAPIVWTQAADLTVQRAAYLHMRWMSSLLEVADVIFDPPAPTSIGEHEFPEGFLYDQLNALVNRDYLYRIGCDPLSTIYFNKDPQFLAAAPATIMNIQAEDWQGEIDFPEPLEPQASYVLASGNAYAAGVLTPLFSEAPGPVPLERGRKDRSLSRIICTNQAALNTLSGLALAAANNDFPDIPVSLEGQYYVGHLFPMELVGLDIQGLPLPGGSVRGTKRDVNLSGDLFVPRRSQLQIVYDQHGAPSHAQVDVNLEKLTTGEGVDGQDLTYPYPTSPDDFTIPGPTNGPSGGDWTPPSPTPPGPVAGDGDLLYLCCNSTGHMVRALHAMALDPNAVEYQDLGVVDAGGIRAMALDSWNPKNCVLVCGANGIWRTTNLNDPVPTWTQVLAVGVMTDIASSIGLEGLWMATRQVGNDLYIYWTPDRGDSWSNLLLSNVCHNDAVQAHVETSSHDANTAWVTWKNTGNTPRVAKTINLWAGVGVHSNLPTATGRWPANPHHRFLANAADAMAIWGSNDEVAVCSAGVATCNITSLPIGGGNEDVYRVGNYTWGTGNYHALTWSSVVGWRFFVSVDGINWTFRHTFVGDVRFVSGWPYSFNRFYAAHDGLVWPLEITRDNGITWQEQTGDWAALGINGVISRTIPVFVE